MRLRMDLYKGKITFLALHLKFLLIIPNLLFASFAALLHCLPTFKGPSIYDVTLQGGVKRSVTVCDRGGHLILYTNLLNIY